MRTLRSRFGAALVVAALSAPVAGCGAGQAYPLPVADGRLEESLQIVHGCASEAGYEARKLDQSVHVHVSPEAWIYFRRGMEGGLEMVVHLPNADGSAVESAAFRDAKQRGDGIWACADQRMHAVAANGAPPAPTGPAAPMAAPPAAPQPAAPPAPAPTPAPPASTSAGGWPTRCAQAVACYLDLTRALCNGATSCKSEVKIKGNPSEEDCTEILRGVDGMLMPLRMARPDLRKPASCELR